LSFLATDIVVAILNGRQPFALTAGKLMARARLPLVWTDIHKVIAGAVTAQPAASTGVAS
jgi:hypothetical protein